VAKSGEQVSELVNESMDAGKHTVNFSQENLPQGIYSFRLEFTGTDKSQNLVLKMVH